MAKMTIYELSFDSEAYTGPDRYFTTLQKAKNAAQKDSRKKRPINWIETEDLVYELDKGLYEIRFIEVEG